MPGLSRARPSHRVDAALVPGYMLPQSLRGQLYADDGTPDGGDRSSRNIGWMQHEMASTRVQGTKPQSLAYGLTGSPVGLAAWITENSTAGLTAAATSNRGLGFA